MLPGPGRARVANADRAIGGERAHAIRHETIPGPVAAAEHVSGAHRGDRHLPRPARRAKGMPPRRSDQLGAGLAAAVRVMATQLLVLAIGPKPFAILIAFVAGHDDDAADR